eukprot:Clim_evm11s247 gene=Clim_evmTU11s247
MKKKSERVERELQDIASQGKVAEYIVFIDDIARLATYEIVPELADSDRHDGICSSVEMFCTPPKASEHLTEWSQTFLMTNEYGVRQYGTCLCKPLEEVVGNALGKRKQWRACAIVSLWPLFDTFLQILRQLNFTPDEETSFSELNFSVSSFLLYEMPMPPPGSLELQFKWGKQRFRINTPSHGPIVDFPLHPVFQHLGLGNVCTVVASLLEERSVVVVTSSPELLPPMIQCFMTLLYPLEWHSTCIPSLPETLVECLESPAPYLIGVEHNVVKSLLPSLLAPQDHIVVCDADIDRVVNGTQMPPNLLLSLLDSLKGVLYGHTTRNGQKQWQAQEEPCDSSSILDLTKGVETLDTSNGSVRPSLVLSPAADVADARQLDQDLRRVVEKHIRLLIEEFSIYYTDAMEGDDLTRLLQDKSEEERLFTENFLNSMLFGQYMDGFREDDISLGRMEEVDVKSFRKFGFPNPFKDGCDTVPRVESGSFLKISSGYAPRNVWQPREHCVEYLSYCLESKSTNAADWELLYMRALALVSMDRPLCAFQDFVGVYNEIQPDESKGPLIDLVKGLIARTGNLLNDSEVEGMSSKMQSLVTRCHEITNLGSLTCLNVNDDLGPDLEEIDVTTEDLANHLYCDHAAIGSKRRSMPMRPKSYLISPLESPFPTGTAVSVLGGSDADAISIRASISTRRSRERSLHQSDDSILEDLDGSVTQSVTGTQVGRVSISHKFLPAGQNCARESDATSIVVLNMFQKMDSIEDLKGDIGEQHPTELAKSLLWDLIELYGSAASEDKDDLLVISQSKKIAELDGAELYRRIRAKSHMLGEIEVGELSPDESFCFWGNCRNALLLHALIELGVPRTRMQAYALHTIAAYQIGNEFVTLTILDRQILRRDMPPTTSPMYTHTAAVSHFLPEGIVSVPDDVKGACFILADSNMSSPLSWFYMRRRIARTS